MKRQWLKSLWLLLLLALGCSLLACRDRDAHATCERILRTGTMRVGMAANPAERSYLEVVLLQRVAARLGARLEAFPAPIPDLKKALAAGVIDAVVLRPDSATGRGAASPSGQASGSAVARLDFTLEGHRVALLIRKGEDRFLAVCRRQIEEAAGAMGALSPPAPSP